ncbi:hypothetical protein MYX78_02030 [Acidobacteria bacterium AH-259-G07]|nr:hypothetical protein [Acidobacteria bacterium AH-259-G07]
MIFATYCLAYVYSWSAPRFSVEGGGVVGEGVTPLQGLALIPLQNLIIGTILGTVVGMIVGWIVLAGRFWRRWMLASTVGFGVGSVLGFIVAQAVVGKVGRDPQGGPVFGSGGDLIVGALAMLLGGIMQWLVLRRQVSWAGLWALASPVGFALLVAVTGGVPGVVGCTIFGAMISAVTGIVLLRLLRRPLPEA